MLTMFGRTLRKLRIDRGELIKDMAEKLGVTASYLSAVETGKRNIPSTWVDEIVRLYHLDSEMRAELEEARIQSAKTIKLDIDALQGSRRETAILFAREFENADEDTLAEFVRYCVRAIMRNNGDGVYSRTSSAQAIAEFGNVYQFTVGFTKRIILPCASLFRACDALPL